MSNESPSVFEQLLRARLAGLTPLLAESGITNHSGSKGSLREKYLRDLLLSVIPAKYRVAGGFICDLVGKISPQLDLILALTDLVPPIGLSADLAFVPREAALAVVEVKSALETGHFDQLNTQFKSISEMGVAVIQSNDEKPTQPRSVDLGDRRAVAENSALTVPMYVFAYESKVSDERIREELKKNPGLRGVCVYNRPYHLFRPGDTERSADSVLTLGEPDSSSGTICFIRNLLDDLRGLGKREQLVEGTLAYHFLGPTDEAMAPYVTSQNDV